MFFEWLIDFICRIVVFAILAGIVFFVVALVILTIGEKRGWWE